MSRLADELRRRRRDWPVIPEALEDAWTWLEQQEFGIETPGGPLLLMSRAEGAQVAFSSTLTLEGWLEPDQPGHALLLPIAEAAGDGSILALWRDGDAPRVVLLGSDGGMGIVADDAEELLTLLAIGYDELSELTLGDEPEEPVDVTEFREWVQTRSVVDIPDAWPGMADDAFGAWMAVQLGEEPSAPTAVASDSPDARIDGDVARFLELLGTPDGPAAAAVVAGILGTTAGATVRSSSRAQQRLGVEVESTRAGIATFWITMQSYPRPTQLIVGLDATSVIDDALALFGTPERRGESWLRYVTDGRFVHLEFEPDGGLWRVTLMVDAP